MVKTTRRQRVALLKLYRRAQSGDDFNGESFLTFRRRVLPAFGCIGIKLWGMYLGIEPDGYTHS